MSDNWMSLLSYSAKYGVSVSTLRRRLKEQSLGFKLEGGKYMVLDQPLDSRRKGPMQPTEIQDENSQEQPRKVFNDETVMESANKLVEEIKVAYSTVLSEKEDLITQLKEEIVDLRMLVKVLEQQVNNKNDRPSSEERPSTVSSSDFVFYDETFK